MSTRRWMSWGPTMTGTTLVSLKTGRQRGLQDEPGSQPQEGHEQHQHGGHQ